MPLAETVSLAGSYDRARELLAHYGRDKLSIRDLVLTNEESMG